MIKNKILIDLNRNTEIVTNICRPTSPMVSLEVLFVAHQAIFRAEKGVSLALACEGFLHLRSTWHISEGKQEKKISQRLRFELQKHIVHEEKEEVEVMFGDDVGKDDD